MVLSVYYYSQFHGWEGREKEESLYPALILWFHHHYYSTIRWSHVAILVHYQKHLIIITLLFCAQVWLGTRKSICSVRRLFHQSSPPPPHPEILEEARLKSTVSIQKYAS